MDVVGIDANTAYNGIKVQQQYTKIITNYKKEGGPCHG